MPSYHVRERHDNLLGRGGSIAPGFSGPCLGLGVSFKPDLPAGLPPHLLKYQQRLAGHSAAFSAEQRHSILSADFLDFFRLDQNALTRGTRLITSVNLATRRRETIEEPVYLVEGQVFVRELPTNSARQRAQSNPHPITFAILTAPSHAHLKLHICLGYEFILEHFEERIECHQIGTAAKPALEYVLKAKSASFCKSRAA